MFSSSSVMLILAVDLGAAVFEDSQNLDEEGEEVMVETPATNITATSAPSRGKKKKLTLAVWQDFDHVKRDLGDRNW